MSSICITQENNSSLKQHQQLLMNLAMRQAFHVLQLPQLELSEWLKNEIEKNPILEIDLSKESFKDPLEVIRKGSSSFRDRVQEGVERRRKDHQESLLRASVSLYEHLMQQAPLAFEDRKDLQLAELIVGHLNDKGFLDTPLCEISSHTPLEKMEEVLKVIQTLDPSGIGARSLQECLLLQLRLKDREEKVAEKIISDHFNDLLHNRLIVIAKRLNIPLQKVVQTIEEQIVPLDLHPGYRFCPHPITAIIPDLFFLSCDEKWKVETNTSYLPHFRIAPAYSHALHDPSLKKEESFYLRRQLAGGKWLKRIVDRRNQTLRSIGILILKKQHRFFNDEQRGLSPMAMQEAADELGVHESTVARAVANKFVACPQGLFSLRSFFNQGVSTTHGQKISNHSLRELLTAMIEKEDKLHPLSDEEITQQFRKTGISCARRTVTKYRAMLKIGPASQRKKFI